MGRVRRLVVMVLVAAAVTYVTACVPSLYTLDLIPAAAVVEQATQVDAADHAPYEYYSARAYLDKAREEAAQANFQDARRFASKAHELGTKALDLSRQRMHETGR